MRYLALIRQAIVEILKENHWHTDAIQAYSTRILAKPSRRKDDTGAWSVSQITESWHEKSSPYIGANTTILDARQFITGMYRKHHAELLREQSARSKNAADGQGDHGPDASAKHYGNSDELCHGHSAVDTYDFILTSRVHQVTMQTFPLDLRWPESVLGSQIFDLKQYEQIALEVARYLIMKHCGFTRLLTEEVRRLVQKLCNEFPFVFTAEVGFEVSNDKHMYSSVIFDSDI